MPPVDTVYQLMVVVPDGMVAESVTGLPRQTDTGDADTPVGGGQVCAMAKVLLINAHPDNNARNVVFFFILMSFTVAAFK